MKRQFPNAYQCGSCGFGPIDHTRCHNLATHHGEKGFRGQGGQISNACPRCEWFSPRLEGEGGWPKWNGILPEGFDATTDGGPAAIQMSRVGYLGGAGGETKNGEQGGGGPTTP